MIHYLLVLLHASLYFQKIVAVSSLQPEYLMPIKCCHFVIK